MAAIASAAHRDAAFETEPDLAAELTDGLDRWADAFNRGWAEDDWSGRFGEERWRALCAAGLTGLVSGTAFGGLGLSAHQTARILERLGTICHDGGLGFTLASHLCSTCIPIERFGSSPLKARYLHGLATGTIVGAHAITEPDSGSDAFAMRTRMLRDGDDYVVSGEKCFVSNAPIAGLFVIYARSDPDKGALGGFSALAVERDTPGLSVGRSVRKMGLRTAPTADLHLDDVRVPAANLIGREGQGYSILDYVMKWEVLSVFAVQLGEMRRRLTTAIAYARERQQFGVAIGSFQAVSHRIADMHIRIESAANWLARVAAAVAGGGGASLETAAAKLFISEANVATALDAIRIHGGAGYMSETGIEAGLRDAVGGLIYSGTSDIQRNRIAAMLGL